MPVRRPPPLRAALTQLAPIAFCTGAALFLGNYAYLGLSGEAGVKRGRGRGRGGRVFGGRARAV